MWKVKLCETTARGFFPHVRSSFPKFDAWNHAYV